MEPNLIQEKAKGLFRYEKWLEEEIFQFQKQAYPHREESLITPRWRWMFLSAAKRLSVEPMVWLYRNASGITAHQGAIAVKLKLGAEERTTGWFVETMALESVRGKAVGPMLVKKALDDAPFNLSLGQTAQMRELQFALGWKQVVPLRSYALVLNPRRVLAEKMGNRCLRWVAAQSLLLHRRLRHLRSRPRMKWEPRASQIDRFGEPHNRLWHEVKENYPCVVVRDASFLNWKFVEQPGQDFARIEIQRDGKVVALATLVIREPNSVYQYRRALLIDLVLSASDREVVWVTLNEVRKVCLQRGADVIVFDVTHGTLERWVASYGFIPREPTRVLLLATGGLSDNEKRLVMEPDNWFLTRADSDIDRPW